MTRPPIFQPQQRPTGRYVIFLNAQPLHDLTWGASLAACHHDDLDEILAVVPSGERDPVWHILDLVTGRICAGWRREEGDWSGILDEETPEMQDLIVFEQPDESGNPLEWGAMSARWTARHDDTRLIDVHDAHLLDLSTSTVSDATTGAPLLVIPALADILDYRRHLEEWAVEHADELDEAAVAAADAEAGALMEGSPLPAGWQDLPTNELRAIVEAAEARLRG